MTRRKPFQTRTPGDPREMEFLLVRHAATIAKAGRELATNFDIPSRDIILSACSEMGISEAKWHQLQSYRIAKEQGGVL